jgi:hypothetical protein
LNYICSGFCKITTKNMATSANNNLLHIINSQSLEANGIMHTHSRFKAKGKRYRGKGTRCRSGNAAYPAPFAFYPAPSGADSCAGAVVIPRLTRDPLKNAEHLIRGLRVKPAMTGLRKGVKPAMTGLRKGVKPAMTENRSELRIINYKQ